MTPVVVTIVRGRTAHLRNHVRGLARQTREHRHVVVRVGGPDPRPVLPPGTEVVDLAVEGRLPLARARNVGAAHADRGDLLVFLDVDVVPDADLVDAYHDAARRQPHDVFIGPVRRGRPAPATAGDADPDPRDPPPPDVRDLPPAAEPTMLWSLSMATSAARFASLGGFDEAYVGWGGEDTDLGLRVATSSARLRWVPSATGLHQWHEVADPAERADEVIANARVFHRRWGRLPYPELLARLVDRGLAAYDERCGIVTVA